MGRFNQPLLVIYGTRGDVEVLVPFMQWFAQGRGSNKLLIACPPEIEAAVRNAAVVHAGIQTERLILRTAQAYGDAAERAARLPDTLEILPTGGDPYTQRASVIVSTGVKVQSLVSAMIVTAAMLVNEYGASVVVSNMWQMGVSTAFVVQRECVLINPYPVRLEDAFPDETQLQMERRTQKVREHLSRVSLVVFAGQLLHESSTLGYHDAARHIQCATYILGGINDALAHLRTVHSPTRFIGQWPAVASIATVGREERLSTAVYDVFVVNFWNASLLPPTDRRERTVQFINRSAKNRLSGDKRFARAWMARTRIRGARQSTVSVFVSFGSMLVVSSAMRDAILELLRAAGDYAAARHSVVLVHTTGPSWSAAPSRGLTQQRIDDDMRAIRRMRNVVQWKETFNHLELDPFLARAGAPPIFVHHGGVGTLTTGAVLGCYHLVVSMLVDQPFWGERVELQKIGTHVESGALERDFLSSGPSSVRELWSRVEADCAAFADNVRAVQSAMTRASDARAEAREWDRAMRAIAASKTRVPFAGGVVPRLTVSYSTLTRAVSNVGHIAGLAVGLTFVVLVCVAAYVVSARKSANQQPAPKKNDPLSASE